MAMDGVEQRFLELSYKSPANRRPPALCIPRQSRARIGLQSPHRSRQ